MSIRSLTPKLSEKARERCNETPEKLKDALKQVKDWLAQQPHINARTDDQWLAAYIRGCKFNLDKVKTKLDLFYTCRHTASVFYQLHHKDAKFKELMETGFYLPLPKLSDPAAPRVSLIRTGAFDVAELGAVEAFAVAQIIDKILIADDDNAIIAGNTIIIDFKDTSLLHMLQLTPIQMKMLIASQQDAFPFRNLTTFVINVPQGFNNILNLMKNLLDEANRGELYVYTENYEEMYTKHGVSKEVMPAEYGGNGGTLQEIIDHWMLKFEEYNEWLEEDLQFGTDESKRPGKPRTAEDMFGETSLMHGNLLQNFMF